MFELQLKGRLYLLKLIILLDFTNLNLTPKSRCKSLEKGDFLIPWNKFRNNIYNVKFYTSCTS